MVTALVWLATIGVWGVVAVPGIVPGRETYFATAMLLALTAQVVVGGCVAGLGAAALRRWLASVVCFASAAFGVARIASVPRAEMVDAPEEASRVVRVLTMNVRPQNSIDAEMAGILREVDADVVFFVEPNWETVELLRTDASIRERWPHAHVPDRAGPGFAIILSKAEQWAGWPRRSNPGRALVGGRLRLTEIRGEFGAFVFGGTFPESPRSPERWMTGQERVRKAIERVKRKASRIGAEDGRPPVLVIAGDLNDTPTGVRRRMLERELGVIETKPWWRAAGTWPAGVAWPVSVSIDAVLVSPEVGVARWQTVAIPGSDHRGVYVDLVLPESAGE